MGGYGKNSRGGKRGSSSSSSSSSSYVSMTTMLLVLACCVFAVYMLTSSSITPPHATPASNNVSHHHHKRNAVPVPPRTILRDPPPAAEVHEDTQGDLPEEAVKGHHESISSLTNNKQEEVTNDSAGTEEDSRSEIEAVQHEKQQQEDVETNPEKPLHEEEVETRLRHDQSHDHEQQQQQEQQHVLEDQAHEQRQQQHEEEINQNHSEEQQQDDPVNGQSNEEQQQQQQSSEHNNEQHQQQHEQHGEEQSNNENQQQQQEQSETNGEEGQRDETNNNESLQQSIDEIDSNHDNNQPQIIQQVTEESNTRSEEGEGISSQSQIEHDTDGTTEHHQQQEQQQEQQEEEHQEQQQQEQQQQQEEEEHQEQQQEQQQQDSMQPQQTEDESDAGGSNENNQPNEDNNDSLLDGGQSAVPFENKGDKKTWATQADQSSNEKERRKGEGSSQSNERDDGGNGDAGKSARQEWELCNATAGPDYIPCLDNEKAIKQLRSFRHFEHRERHCPEESPTCLVPLPKGYKRSIQWPQSRDRIWYNNVPRTKLAEVKGHQNWVKVTGEYLAFPGGGTQFIHGALHYIDFIQQSVPEIAWGKHTRVILDVGCGVASFGGYLFERDVLAMSFAPKDEHEAQVQFALERGIPAISAVMGSQRLPFPSRVFDIVHCARCRVPWHANDGALLLELNRVLRPGGFFVWSATPVYQKLKEDVEIWEAMTTLTKSMCWELFTIKKDKLNSVGAAMYRKPVTNDCYENRNEQEPPMCEEDDDPNAAWYVPLQSCMHRVPVDRSVRGSQWPLEWPRRAQVPPYWLNNSQMGVYGRSAPDDFTKDYEHWRRVVNKSYLNGFGIDWSKVRNVMDMRAVYGGFAAALKGMKLWVMNLVNIDSPDTLPIIYERGLFGMYHDWCESFSTYPRTYDLLHADHLFSQVRKRCKILPVVAEVDRITRPGGKLIVRDESDVVGEVENLLKSLHWQIRLTYSRNKEGIVCAEKSDWRPEKISSST